PPAGGGTGTTSVSPSAVCDAGTLKVNVTASATGTLRLTRVRVTVDGRSLIEAPASGQTFSNSATTPATAGSHRIVATAEDSTGQAPATTSLSPVCNE